MKEQVLQILRRTAGRLGRTRLAETWAVTLTAGLLSAAAMEAAWSAAEVWRPGAVLICLLPVLAGAMLLLPGLRRRLELNVPCAAGVIAIFVAAGLAGAVLAGMDKCLTVPRWSLAPAMILAGLLSGLAARGHGVTLREAAVYLDVHCRTGERLSTALELIQSPRCDDDLARCVYAQAAEVLRKHSPEGLGMWKRTPATLGAMGLAALLAAGAWFLPGEAAGLGGSVGKQMAEAMQTLSMRQKKELADAFRLAAKNSGKNSELSAGLLRAAQVIEVDDARQLQEVIALLEKHGFHPLEIVPRDLRLVPGLNEQTPGAAPAGMAGNFAPGAGGLRQGDANQPVATASDANGNYVTVFDPLYSRSAAGGGGEGGRNLASGGVGYGDEWLSARKAAAEHLASGKTPAEYRQMVRDFFALNE